MKNFLFFEDWLFFFLVFIIIVIKDLYVVDYGSNVIIECKFLVEELLNLVVLIVYWEMENKKII